MAAPIETKYLTPAQVCEIVPGMTQANLRQLRFKGVGPKYHRPTPRVIVYSESEIADWLARSERTGTAQDRR